MDEETFEFDSEFEFKILALCARDKKFLSTYHAIICSSYFNSPENFLIASSILFYYEKYKSVCDRADLRQIISTKGKQTQNEGAAQRALKSLDVLYSLPIEEAVLAGESIIEFVEQNSMAQAVLESAEILDGNNPDKKKIVLSKIESAYRKTEIMENIGKKQLDYLETFVENISKPASETRIVPTGFPHLDQTMKFGALASGTIAEIQGPQKRFKSGLLANFAHNAARAPYNKNVIIYTMELSEEDYLERINSRTAKMSLQDIKQSPNEFIRRVKTKISNGTIGGQIIVKYFEGNTAKISDLQTHYEQLKKENFKADLVIFDYLDLLLPEKSYKGDSAKRFGIADVYRAARNWGARDDFAIWTAGHTSKQSSKMKIIDDTHSAESHDKQRILDYCVTLNQTKKEHRENELRLHVIANRGGPMWGFVRVKTIPNIYYAKSLEYIEPTVDDIAIEEAESAKRYKKRNTSEKEEADVSI